MARLFRGHIFHIAGSPAGGDVASHLVSLPDGVLAVADNGTVAWVGSFPDLPDEYADAPVEARVNYLLPGFVDTHVHFPQSFATAAHGGGQLLEWLEHCIFPMEARLADDAFADHVARYFSRRRTFPETTS